MISNMSNSSIVTTYAPATTMQENSIIFVLIAPLVLVIFTIAITTTVISIFIWLKRKNRKSQFVQNPVSRSDIKIQQNILNINDEDKQQMYVISNRSA